MNLLQQIVQLFNFNNQDNNILSLLGNVFSNNTSAQAKSTNYYQLPTYNYDQKPEQAQQNVPNNNESNDNLTNIIKIAGVLLQYLLSKNKKENSPKVEIKPTTVQAISKIEKLKRTDDKI